MGKASRAKKIRRETEEERPVKPPKVLTTPYKTKEEKQEERQRDRRIARANAAWMSRMVRGTRFDD